MASQRYRRKLSKYLESIILRQHLLIDGMYAGMGIGKVGFLSLC
ncbi:hypothetical protein [Noviherbaspirillum pedocola]|nr:hypothetical protein [Noviherbaspirillum pedocola]